MCKSITVSRKAFKFLKRIENNNNREWFNIHKPEFKLLEADVKLFYIALLDNLQQHDTIEKLKMFRIYRDVRFSKDKTPYNSHFSGYYSRMGERLRGSYYLKIKPNNQSFIGVGFWNPNKEDLFRIRKEFEIDDSEIRAILAKDEFKKTWGSFVGDEVKTAPKGFSKEHSSIDLIRKKQFIFTKKFTDKEVLSANFIIQVNTAFKTIRPYLDFMSNVLTTNLNGESLIK